ncbi:MAG: transposase [Okeania sp. SIO3C4]|nr:transposase [Okeania sp. SIO3C4]
MSDLSGFISEHLSMEAQRGLCVHLDQLGYSSGQIQEILQVSQSYVSKWVTRYKKTGLEALPTQYKGKPSYLSEGQKAELLTHLSAQDSYSLSQLVAYIRENYGVVFKSQESYYQLLRAGGLSWHRTQKSNPKKNEAQVLARRAELKKNWIRSKKR